MRLRRPLPAVQGDTLHIVGVGDNRIGKQRTPATRLFRFELFDTQNIREAVGDLICGIGGYEVYEVGLKLRELNGELDNIQIRLRALHSALPRDQAFNTPELIQTAVDNLDRERFELQQQVDNVDLLVNPGEVKEYLAERRTAQASLIRQREKLQDLELAIKNLDHRAECLTHVGDSQAVRSLTQCGEPMRFAMAAPIDLRNDFDSVSLRRLAKRTRDATQSRRLLALAEVYDGGGRTDASRIGGVGLQIIRDWVLRFNARGPDGLVDGKSPGAPSKLNADHRRALAEVVEAGPVPAVDGVVRWRRKDLARWLLETFAISLDETTVGRELKALGFAKISARPRHYAQNELAVEAFKKNFPAELAKIRARLPKGVEIELWWQDEARIGQKNKLTRRWARRGTRPRAPRDQRTEWAYIFGAICPAKGKGAGLVMPWCDTDAMAAHLIEISAAVDPGAHAVLIVDQAGWHLTPKLAIPDNITVLALPPRSPELNPVENVWQFMRDNWLSNRIFKSCEDIVALCCQAWNNLIDQPWKIMSLGMRKWAHGF